MRNTGNAQPAGDLGLRVIRGDGATSGMITEARPGRELSFRDIVRYGNPQPDQPADVQAWKRQNLKQHLGPAIRRFGPARFVARKAGMPYFWSQLWLKVIRANGRELDLGLAGIKVVTTTGAGFIVDAFQNTVELETMKYHGIGTDSTAENASDTALGTELTTTLNPDNTRATGTTAEGASANIYQTVGTNTVDAAGQLLREHGVLSQAATGGGVLLDRTVFALITLGDGDSLESTYELTITAGS